MARFGIELGSDYRPRDQWGVFLGGSRPAALSDSARLYRLGPPDRRQIYAIVSTCQATFLFTDPDMQTLIIDPFRSSPGKGLDARMLE